MDQKHGPMNHFDTIIIGSGQGGTPLAIRLARAGYKTALIEQRAIGGTCINDGCIPSKSIIASAKMAYAAAHAGALGIRNTDCYEVDFARVMQREKEIAERFRKSSEHTLNATPNLEVIMGTASFSGIKEISIAAADGGLRTCTGNYFFINTGTRPLIPDIEGLRAVPYLTTTTLLELEALPAHLIILGGGYTSLELGQAFRRFGSKVTIIEKHETILEREDEDIRSAIASLLEEEQITLLTGASTKKVQQNSYRDIVAGIVKNGTHAVVTGSHLLVAAGRQPNTEVLQPGRSGIALDPQGYIKVNDRLETNISGIYALGDVKGGPAFTHIAYNDYRIVYRNLAEKANLSVKERLVPYTMFTDPELGRIGITEREALEQGYNITVARLEMSKVTRGIIEEQRRGLLKAVVDKRSGKILGASFWCMQGGELMSVLQMAMQAGFTWDQVKELVFAHPTLSESLNNLFFTIE